MYNNFYQPQTDERIWVQNKFAADVYLVAPNSFVRLWDASRPVFYEKRADANGRPLPLEVYEYKKVVMQTETETNNAVNYQEQIDSIIKRLDTLERGSNESNKQPNADDNGI